MIVIEHEASMKTMARAVERVQTEANARDTEKKEGARLRKEPG